MKLNKEDEEIVEAYDDMLRRNWKKRMVFYIIGYIGCLAGFAYYFYVFKNSTYIQDLFYSLFRT